MANGLHTQLKRGSWTRQISLSTASGYRRASRRRGVSFTIELVIHALANSLLGLDGTAYAATMDLSNWEVAWTCSYRSDTSQLSGRGRCPGVFFSSFVATMPALGQRTRSRGKALRAERSKWRGWR
jgi:hypothetical protein